MWNDRFLDSVENEMNYEKLYVILKDSAREDDIYEGLQFHKYDRYQVSSWMKIVSEVLRAPIVFFPKFCEGSAESRRKCLCWDLYVRFF